MRTKKYIKLNNMILFANIIFMIIIVIMLFGFKTFANNKSDDTNKETKTAYVFIGDIRTVDMDRVIGLSDMEDMFVIADDNADYDWFMENAISQIFDIRETYIGYNNWIYIVNLGIKDLSNIKNYKKIYNMLSEYNSTVYYLSINPTNDDVSDIKCEDIIKFNKEIYSLTYNNYINSYQYLTDVSGFTFAKRNDGIRYSDETYKKLYDFIMVSIDVHQFVENNEDRYSAYYYLYNVK